eukprot:4954346-Amphidinium_carterae.1
MSPQKRLESLPVDVQKAIRAQANLTSDVCKLWFRHSIRLAHDDFMMQQRPDVELVCAHAKTHCCSFGKERF